jgi:triacylglycerol lipase
MDLILELFKQRPRDNWQWTLDPIQKGWSKGNALALANCSLLAYSDQAEIDKQLKQRGFEAVIPCQSSHSMDAQAYLAVRADATVIAFRGTEPTNERDFAADFNTRQIPFEAKLNFNGWGRVHEGWIDGVNAVLLKIAEALRVQDNGTRSLWLTGHSSGGALAMLTAAFLANVPNSRIAGVFTYGQPRVGDPAFRTSYDRVLGNVTFRCVNDHDPVPHLPPRELSRIERTVISGGVTGVAELFGFLTPLLEAPERYEHAGQLRLLLANGGISTNVAEESAREPEFLAHPRTARSLFLELPKFLIEFPALLKDHLPINYLTHDGYVDRIDLL